MVRVATRWIAAARSVFVLVAIGAAIAASSHAAENAAASSESTRPRLIVLVSVDQLPQDYWRRFGDSLPVDGFFARAANQGSVFTDCHHGHAFTFTGPGHAVLMTGAYPRTSGVIGNSWYDRESNKTLNCVADAEAKTVGGQGAGASAKNLQVPTVGDQMKLAFGPQAKVFAIGWKDRSPILTAGRLADAAYWFDDDTGHWVTSDAFQSELPGWLRVLNEGRASRAFGGQAWTLLYPAERYHSHVADDNKFEKPGSGLSAAFPHELPAGEDAAYFKRFAISPFASQYTIETARELILREELGRDATPDCLALCLSANDYVGHAFGPHSLEAEDMFYRTDRMLAEFATFLDEQVGAGRWTLALSSDHGVAPIPEYAASLGLEAARSPLGSGKDVQANAEGAVRVRLGVPAGVQPSFVLSADSTQVFLRRDHPRLAGEAFEHAQDAVRDWLLDQPSVADAVTRAELLAEAGAGAPLRAMFHRAFHKQRSGDVLYALKPLQFDAGSLCTSHGSPWNYDTHVPLVFLGARVGITNSSRHVHPGSIAPTLAAILDIEAPAGCEHECLTEALAP
ncbi:MAG: alkaline phosphatase family protein [Planctomycetales bacterium]|nr:alkaline phosphatase family protein [Planctomycetales bacterium]